MPLTHSNVPSPTRRDLLAGALATAAGTRAAAQPANPSRPNILYIHSHDTGRYLSPYGHDIPTPNLQKLAGQGVLFRSAFSAAPTCSPSRASLLTGQCAHQNGMLGLAHRGFSLYDYGHHLLYPLRAAGYQSILGGLQHIAAKPETIGYDQILYHRTQHVADVAPAVTAFLDSRPKEPFFLDVGFFETHREYQAPTADDQPRVTQPPRTVPDRPETRADMAAFHSSARTLDHGVGQVLDALERNGYASNTLVISTTDHGISFPRMKCNLTDDGWGVSLILRGPGLFPGGRTIDAMISQLDVYPTLCDLLGIEHPVWLEGKSFLPLLRGENREINEQIFAEVNYHAAYEPMRAVRTRRYKYIRRFGGRRNPVLPNCDDGLSKSVWLAAGWKNRSVPEEELYDLTFDPGEENNLIASAGSSAQAEDMRARLDRWMHATNDPLLRGPVAAPHGARINDPDGISPKEPTIRVP